MRCFACLVLLLPPCLAFVPQSRMQGSSALSKRVSPLKYAIMEDQEQKQELTSKLPPIDTNRMSKFEIEFRELLEDILYTTEDIESITHPRMRAIYEGVAASYHEPAVYRAFEVLYEDYTPLRVAGRIVHNKLMDNMEESKKYKQSQIEAVLSTTEISLEDAKACWSAFVRLTEDREISIEKIKRYLDIEDSILSTLQPHGRKGLTFEQLIVSLSDTSVRNLPNILQEAQLVKSNDDDLILDRQRVKYNERYDEMLEQFAEWKGYIPDGEGRRLDILRGCFVGSENVKVVEALRVIYVDYTALRLSGNWIFKVVATLMGAAKRRRKQ